MATILRKILVSVFGLVPSIWLSYYAILGLLRFPQTILFGRYFEGLYMLIFGSMCLFGTYSMFRYLLGRPINSLRVGMIAGATTMATIAIAPFLKMYLASIGAIELRFNSGMDNYGILMGFSTLAAGPLIVFLVLSYAAICKNRIEVDSVRSSIG